MPSGSAARGGSLPLWQGPRMPGRKGQWCQSRPLRRKSGPRRGPYRGEVTISPGWPVAWAIGILLLLTLLAYAVGHLPERLSPLLAAARAIVQLSLAALVITSVIASLAWSVVVLAGMFTVAVVTTVRRVGAPRAWPWATVAILAGLVPVVAVILLTRTIPPTGLALIPVLGILMGNTMNGHTLACRRAFAALREERDAYDAWLALGFTRSQAIGRIVHRHLPEALVPGLDQIRTAGVVTLPGAFIGVLLGGGSPAQAAAAQVLVLMGIMAAQTITTVVAERLMCRSWLLPEDLRESLRP
jgi:putative ABC transport system permease protein